MGKHNKKIKIEFMKTTLINLFSKYSVDDIDANNTLITKAFNGEWKDSYPENDIVYITYYPKVRNTKKWIEGIVKRNRDNISDQVRELLLFIHRNKDDKYICAELVKKSYCEKWDTKNRTLFNSYYDLVLNTEDYFISYTNREAARTYTQCQSIFKVKPPIKQRKKKNSVAVLIHEELSKRHLKGFFDRDSLKCGDDIGGKILNYCKKAFAFIQLIERQSFEDQIQRDNWCYFEYCIFKNPRGREYCECCCKRYNCDIKESIQIINCEIDKKVNRIFFLLVDREINYIPGSSPLEYEKWYSDILNKQYAVLENLESDAFEAKMIEITNLIKKAKKDFIEELYNLD